MKNINETDLYKKNCLLHSKLAKVYAGLLALGVGLFLIRGVI